jgi:TRAP-type mannitol/chloroaromatic compound transport system permease large subunit
MSVNEILGTIMLFGMVGVIFFGFPISFTLLFLALVFGGVGLGWEQTFNLAYLQIWGTMKDEIFPAVPLFIFMGYMTEQAGLMERLFGALRSLLAPVRGSLYLAVILTATIFAMATGIVGAAVTVLGIMAGPMMIKSGYDGRLSSGAIAAGGTLGVLIPPSVMLVVMGPTMGVPVNLLYSAAFGPGLLLAGSYIAYTLIRSFINPKLGPAMTMDERKEAYQQMTTEKVNVGVLFVGAVALVSIVYVLASSIFGGLGFKMPEITFSFGRRKPGVDVIAALIALATLVPFFMNRYFRAIVLGIAPLAALIGATLGTILKGAATPTEAASCGAAGAALLALVYGKLSLDGTKAIAIGGMLVGALLGFLFGNVLIPGPTGLAFAILCLALVPGVLMSTQMRTAAYGTMVTSGMVLFLAVASNVFGAVFTKLGTAGMITNALVALPLGDWMKLFLIMALIFVLGWPFEWPAIILVFLPIFLPVIEKLNLGLSKLDMLIWFGALVAVNLQTAFLSPPVAMSAYYLKNVVPQWSLAMIYRGMADYMVIQVIVLVLMLLFPQISLWLVHVVR